MSISARILAGLRLGLSQALGGAARRLEPRRDPSHLARQLERGALVWRAFLDAGTALRRAGRFDESDAMVARGLAVFPADAALLQEHALSAHSAGRYALAIARWEAALAAAPDVAMCHAGLAANLRETGAWERAAGVIAAARRRFPDDLTVLSEAARVADVRLRFDESQALWHRAVRHPNPPAEWLQGEAHALLRLGRLDEAARVLERARALHPDAPGPLAVEALLAAERGEPAASLALWSDYIRRFPDDPLGAEQLARAEEQAKAAPAAHGADPGLRELLSRFRSLGETDEFELVQQRCGIDRTSIIWHQAGVDGLIAALGERFAGFGEAPHTRAAFGADGRILVEGDRWPLRLSCVRRDGEGDDDALARALRETALWRERLLADLAAPDAWMVHRSPGLDADGLERLHHALRAFGPVKLIEVRPAAPTAPSLHQGAAGDVVEVASDRYVGFLERLDPGSPADGGLRDWIAICRRAVALAG